MWWLAHSLKCTYGSNNQNEDLLVSILKLNVLITVTFIYFLWGGGMHAMVSTQRSDNFQE